MKSKYPEAFIEQALTKVYSREGRTIQSVADELNIGLYQLKDWMKKSVSTNNNLDTKARRPQDWCAEEQLVALIASDGLSGEALNTWCRERGIFTHNLDAWRKAFCTDKPLAASGQDLRLLKTQNAQLKRELTRKEKALAEAAALLILQKKYRALWGEEVE